jgi:glyoxylase-like metal-dependent hydrolase (beta-lactamase superfamily II)
MRSAERVVDELFWMRTLMSNVCFVGAENGWVLIDAGFRGYSQLILEAARALFGSDRPPAAILLTHAHFDHVGNLRGLLRTWDVPVFAHELELPYLTGRSAYPPPDPLAGGGALAWAAKLYPRRPLNVDGHVEALPHDGEVPGLPGWRWLATPGHTAGHVSFVREQDCAIVAGDAVMTTRQESLMAAATQAQELHGPPAYYTQNWYAAAQSVRTLADQRPSVLLSGHGRPMCGSSLRSALINLADRFERDEVPRRGRYVRQPARANETGVIWVPPDPLPRAVLRAVTPLAAGLAAFFIAKRRRKT